MKPLVYIAAPYSTGDQVVNSRNAIEWGQLLYRDGRVVPFIPHLSIAWHMMFPQPLEFWYAYDLAMLQHCHALLRLEGTSAGADAEVAEAQRLGLPVFGVDWRGDRDVTNLLEWAKQWKGARNGR